MKDDFETLFDSNFLRWFHLNDGKLLIEINKIEKRVEMYNVQTKETDYKPVLHYKVISGSVEKPLPFIVNKTNGRAIAAIHGRSISGWTGKQIVLYVTEARVGREKKPCLRVREYRG